MGPYLMSIFKDKTLMIADGVSPLDIDVQIQFHFADIGEISILSCYEKMQNDIRHEPQSTSCGHFPISL